MNRGPAFLWLLNSKHRPGSLHFISLVGTTPPEAVMYHLLASFMHPFHLEEGLPFCPGKESIIFFSSHAKPSAIYSFSSSSGCCGVIFHLSPKQSSRQTTMNLRAAVGGNYFLPLLIGSTLPTFSPTSLLFLLCGGRATYPNANNGESLPV